MPDPGFNQATLKLELLNKPGTSIQEATINWTENKLVIESLNKFVGNNQVRFILRDENMRFIDATNTTIEIKSDNATTFKLEGVIK